MDKLALFVAAGLVKRSRGGLFLSPRHVYKSEWEGHQSAKDASMFAVVVGRVRDEAAAWRFLGL